MLSVLIIFTGIIVLRLQLSAPLYLLLQIRPISSISSLQHDSLLMRSKTVSQHPKSTPGLQLTAPPKLQSSYGGWTLVNSPCMGMAH